MNQCLSARPSQGDELTLWKVTDLTRMIQILEIPFVNEHEPIVSHSH